MMATAAATSFTVIVEIKRPDTSLVLDEQYRNGAHKLGPDLVGGVVQVQQQCFQWQEQSVLSQNREILEAQRIFTHEPKGILVIGNTNTLSIEILTPAAGGKQLHFTGAVTTENAADLVFQELIEVSANGAALTPRNANRNFGDGSTVQATLKNSTVVTTNAVVLDSRHIGTASTSPSRPGVGGGAESRGEWILRENTWYQLKLTNISGASQDMHLAVEWYEHTPKG